MMRTSFSVIDDLVGLNFDQNSRKEYEINWSMENSVIQALNGLVPTLNGPLEPDLTELASSLLVQSRSKASTLKADEEIARAYACAHLACERLKQSLGLPKIQPRPPCPPKVYKKLYKFLDNTLPARTKRQIRAPVLSKAEVTPKSSSSRPKTLGKATPTKQATPQNRPPRQLTDPVEVPEWVMPVIRLLCQKLGAPAAPHHIFAGVSSILTLPTSTETNITGTSMDATKKIPALIMIVFLTVYARLTAMETPVDIFMDQKEKGFGILKEYMGKEAVGDEINDDDFDKLILVFRDRGWTQMDWFDNIAPGTGLGLDHPIEESYEADSENDEATQQESLLNFHDLDGNEKDYLQAGLNTMMQDKVDYLSEKRRLHYQKWKKGILLLIEELEQRDEMEQEAE